ncbi:type II toxin-antitoxin system RelE/ParE family toxin [Thalassotalea sp. 1_MG-2023]|uniref:type II toxin-antitoxin system RelE/ParE family toxin n=1 Tax=Thalassotalea sp. 1_MG-2023 TaxID=3062680 RepID=UPI0026E2238B|nr:type II toxin-antitoxin system RelE/ParE family toxin [Thalassotalea sp. 1_MG-2023]MDO6427242.1 type II toxin-antitoxin system RelE/ParE family toxin [Thalassotalea sp. 1_MG-2023]
MEHLLCINTNSFPAVNKEEAISLFMSSLQGVLELFVGDDDRVVFYLDTDNNAGLQELELSSGFFFNDFLLHLEERNELDLLTVLYEIIDKSPALDYFNDEQLDNISQYTYYIAGYGLHDRPEVFSISNYFNAKLFSLETGGLWRNHKLTFTRTEAGEYNSYTVVIDNIANKEHGRLLSEEYSAVELSNACPNSIISSNLTDWFNGLDSNNKLVVYNKLRYCNQRGFRGNEPLFKQLQNADSIWEARFDAYSGGTIRVLYKLHDQVNILLLGFIKKSNNEGYDTNIERAKRIFDEMTNAEA